MKVGAAILHQQYAKIAATLRHTVTALVVWVLLLTGMTISAQLLVLSTVWALLLGAPVFAIMQSQVRRTVERVVFSEVTAPPFSMRRVLGIGSILLPLSPFLPALVSDPDLKLFIALLVSGLTLWGMGMLAIHGHTMYQTGVQHGRQDMLDRLEALRNKTRER
jgi:hypothetical protein